MRPTLTTRAFIGAAAFATAAAAGEAKSYRHYDSINYRVVDIAGSDHLNLRSRPSTRGAILAEIPFDQRGLATTGDTQSGWIELRFWDEDGRAITGWASANFLEEDLSETRVTYAVTGIRRQDGLEISREEGYGRRVGTLAWNATGIESRGACAEAHCPVRFHDRSGSLRGWVLKDHLKVERYTVQQPADEPNGDDVTAYEEPTTSDNYWDDVRRRREERREKWRAYWRKFWTGDRHATSY